MDLEIFLATAAGLLAVPSTADRPAELSRALEMVIRLAGPGVTVERFTSGGKPSALLYRGQARPHFRIILNAHLDVVPGGPEQFRPRREGGRLYARGAQDMKVSALVMTQVFRELAGGLPHPLGLQLVTDEEVGGRDGTLHQLEEGVTADFVLIGEASGLRLVADSKGRINARLRAHGRAAHGAYPWLGDNALVKLHRSLSNMLAAYPVPAEEVWQTTVNLARIETANQAFNQIPDQAEAWLDIRFPADDTDLNGKTAQQIAAHLAGFCEPGVTAVVDSADPARHASADRPEMVRLSEAITRQGYRPDLLRLARHVGRPVLLPAGHRRGHLRRRRKRPARPSRIRRHHHGRALLPGADGLSARPRARSAGRWWLTQHGRRASSWRSRSGTTSGSRTSSTWVSCCGRWPDPRPGWSPTGTACSGPP